MPDRTAVTWKTVPVNGTLTDVGYAADGRAVVVSRLAVPLAPFDEEACPNCGGAWATTLTVRVARPGERVDLGPHCNACTLTPDKNLALHRALMVRLGAANFVEGVELAAQAGRHVLALKMAAAAFHYGLDRDLARALRLERLVCLGLLVEAEREARAWLARPKAPPFIASLVADILCRRGENAEALAVLDRGVDGDPEDRTLRLERAELREEIGHTFEAVEDAAACLGREDAIATAAVDLCGRVADELLRAGRLEQARRVVDMAGAAAHRHARLCFVRAVLEERRGALADSRRWLRHALELDPAMGEVRQQLGVLEQRMGLANTSHLV